MEATATKSFSFPNGALKKHSPGLYRQPSAQPDSLYRECLKNHAASIGGHALDGCGEFMPSPSYNPSDPTSLKCAACGCHRNFHRRLPDPPVPLALQPRRSSPPPAPPSVHQAILPPFAPGEVSPANGPLRHPHIHAPRDEPSDDDASDDEDDDEYDDDEIAHRSNLSPPPGNFASAPHMLLSLSTGAPSSGPAPAHPSAAPAPAPAAHVSSSEIAPRKRFRTKFSPEQKQRMQALSERLGWRLQKRDEGLVEEWCREIGVNKGVFKVWMHNNKHTFLGTGKRGDSSGGSGSAGRFSDIGISNAAHSGGVGSGGIESNVMSGVSGIAHTMNGNSTA